jgi:hypothetical protein
VGKYLDTPESKHVPTENIMTLESLAASRPTQRAAFSIQEFCAAFSIGRSKVFEEIRAGRLKARKAGARTLIANEDALEWLNALPARSR